MAQFTNQAQLTYNNTVTVSNLAVGEIQDVLSMNKTAVNEIYTSDDTITYAVNIVNSGSADLTGLTLTDDLGAYEFGTGKLVPLDYADGTVKFFRNSVLQPAPTAEMRSGELAFTNFSVPANGTATFIYETMTNRFTPLVSGSKIVNTARLSGSFTSLEASAEAIVSGEPELSIVKSISPIPVAENGAVKYTFVIQNSGNTPVEIGAVITDTFKPVISNVSAMFNDVLWTAGSDYTYDTSTGLFTSLENRVTVAAAQYSQDPDTGEITVTPGTSTLIITGTV